MRDIEKGTYNELTTYCPNENYGICPYCDQLGVCHIDDPQEDCDEWQGAWESWTDWILHNDNVI